MHTSKKVPPKIPEEYFCLLWSNKKIWGLDLPTGKSNFTEFEWHMDAPFWPSNPPRNIFDLTPRTVLENPTKYPKEFDKVQSADISFPIDALRIQGKLVILDGIHRLCRLYLERRLEVLYREIPQTDLVKILRRNPNKRMQAIVAYGHSADAKRYTS